MNDAIIPLDIVQEHAATLAEAMRGVIAEHGESPPVAELHRRLAAARQALATIYRVSPDAIHPDITPAGGTGKPGTAAPP